MISRYDGSLPKRTDASMFGRIRPTARYLSKVLKSPKIKKKRIGRSGETRNLKQGIDLAGNKPA